MQISLSAASFSSPRGWPARAVAVPKSNSQWLSSWLPLERSASCSRAVARETSSAAAAAAAAGVALASSRCRAAKVGRRAGAPWDSFFGSSPVKVPSSTNETMEALKGSIEVAVKGGLPRVDVELPSGLRLGVENVMDPLVLSEGEVGTEQISQADRELARLFLAMFKAVNKNLTIAFRTSSLAAAAKEKWGAKVGNARIVSLGK
ncbi:unnamed protein product, partial [Polarella glacialis]